MFDKISAYFRGFFLGASIAFYLSGGIAIRISPEAMAQLCKARAWLALIVVLLLIGWAGYRERRAKKLGAHRHLPPHMRGAESAAKPTGDDYAKSDTHALFEDAKHTMEMGFAGARQALDDARRKEEQ